MYTVYFIVSEKTSYLYIGMTGKKRSLRMAQHRHAAKSGKKSPLYDCMRKHGPENFLMVIRDVFPTKAECQKAEREWITTARKEGWKILNLADGGEGGYVVPEHRKDEWKAKLSKARVGRKPALGMKHTDDNKKKFSEVSKSYWETQDTYSAEEVAEYSFKEANKLFGISKTHYYRLLKRAESNDLS